MKNYIVVTGGAGFVGSNLIEFLANKTKYKILSLDNYSSGNKKNHIKNKRVKYIKGKTVDIEKIIKKPKEINSVFHFGEFSIAEVKKDMALRGVKVRSEPLCG